MSVSSRLFSRLLLTNDDGIDAPGLRTLTEVATELAEGVWVVAPDHDQSGTSHSLSLHSPLARIAKGRAQIISLRNSRRLRSYGRSPSDGVGETGPDPVGH